MAGLIPKISLLREEAKKVVPKDRFDYVDGAADDEYTSLRNREGWKEIKLVPRVLRHKGQSADTTCQLFGDTFAAPIIVAPMAGHGWMHDEGEYATAKAAQNCGIPLVCLFTTCLSNLSTYDADDILKSGTKPILYQQIYLSKQEWVTAEVLKASYANGIRTILLTVDTPVLGNRQRDNFNKSTALRSKLMFCQDPQFNTMLSPAKLQKWMERLSFSPEKEFDEYIAYPDWNVVSWIKSIIDVKVVLKGILSPEDAKLAVEAGADGIVVSNHGGRQLDTAVTSCDVLPSIAKAVDGRIPILADGGIQRGTDVLKALALGASAVMIGRPVLYALAAGGSDKIEELLQDLKKEFERSLLFCGCSCVADITPDLLWK